MDNEDDLPDDPYRNVHPLKQVPREPVPVRKPDNIIARRTAATTPTISPDWPAGSLAGRGDTGPDTLLAFHRAGLPLRQWGRLRRGELHWEMGVDLHGCTLAEGIAAVRQLIEDALASRERCIHVVHGKGLGSAPDRPSLKTTLDGWLREQPDVLAFSSALPRHGGTGALYVLLRNRRDR